MKIGIGIDTGGTCTDAAAVDLNTGKLLAKGKTETTREDLSIGIGKALDMLPPELIKQASEVALSTTLATNACIEDKGCRAKLVIFGIHDEYLRRMHAPENYNLKPENVLCVDTHSSADGLIIDEPDWEQLFKEHGDWLKDSDALCAVELYSSETGAPCEKHFKQYAEERTGKRCINANELTEGINIFARGATALLNARLLPVVKEFTDAAEKDFKERGCTAPLRIVRSDGCLMSDDYSLIRPVDTILSGPAASVLAGKAFSDGDNYIIVDMGGTSTDISVVSGGYPVLDKEGTKIGAWRTSVRGIKVYPFNLGGDSAIRLDKMKLRLYPRRVLPICAAASRWPDVIIPALEKLVASKHYNPFPLHEFFFLAKEPEDISLYTENERKLIDHVRSGPKILERLLPDADIDIYGLDSERLESEGIVMRCGLTPTDFMHIKGDFLRYDRSASILAARYILQQLGREETDEEIMKLADEAYERVEAKMFGNIIEMGLRQAHPSFFKGEPDEQLRYLIDDAWKNRNSKEDRILGTSFFSGYTLIGIGAPTHLFLPEAARALGARFIVPEHAEVANAIGALKATLSSTARVNITSRFSPDIGTFMYIVNDPEGSFVAGDLNDAVKRARRAAEREAKKEAVARGASGKIVVSSHIEQLDTVDSVGIKVTMGRCAVAEAHSL